MDTTVIKLLLAVAILFVLWKVMGRRGVGLFSRGGGGMYAGPRPHYSGEMYTEGDEDAEDEYMDDEEESFQNYDASNPLLSVSTSLLPKTTANMGSFAEFAPKADVIRNQNLLDPAKFIGANTIGSSMKNSNYDLRSAPSIPRREVGPWMQSTIDPDPYRKPLE
jgi:hypothetical protein